MWHRSASYKPSGTNYELRQYSKTFLTVSMKLWPHLRNRCSLYRKFWKLENTSRRAFKMPSMGSVTHRRSITPVLGEVCKSLPLLARFGKHHGLKSCSDWLIDLFSGQNVKHQDMKRVALFS